MVLSNVSLPRRIGTILIAAPTAMLLMSAGTANAEIVPTVPLATSANYSVLGGATVTNTGPSVLDGSVGVYSGTAITGFSPGNGTVNAPGIIDANASQTAFQAQADLTLAYDNAAGRPLNATTTADLSGLTLVGGVYAGPSKGALGLTGTLTLDGQGDPNSVFIFQTNAELITGPSSVVALINGAQECNVFWQVGSSATLDTYSVFVGNILALTSITVNTGVVVHGRALARNGQTSLDNDVFRSPTCDMTAPTTTTAAPEGTTDTTSPGGAETTMPGGAETTAPGGADTTAPGSNTTAPGSNTTPVVTTPGGGTIPRTGSQTQTTLLLASAALVLGAAATAVARRKTVVVNSHSVGG